MKPLGPVSERSYGAREDGHGVHAAGRRRVAVAGDGALAGDATGVAVSVQSAGTLPEPEAAGSTTLTSVSVAGWSLLLIVHVAASPGPTVTVAAAGSDDVAPEHDHGEAV